MELIPNNWKYLLRIETSSKSLLKTFYANKGTRKVIDLQKLSNKEIYFTLQSNSTKYNKLFKFVPSLNFLEGHHILSLEIWGKTFPDCFMKCSDSKHLLTLWYIEWAMHQILCVLDVKNEMSLTPILYSIINFLKLL